MNTDRDRDEQVPTSEWYDMKRRSQTAWATRHSRIARQHCTAGLITG